jgi:hypothetical protein
MTRVAAAALILSAAVWPVHAQPPARGAAVSGRVVDEFGDPVINARVFAEVPATPGTQARTLAATSTDDRGEYRMHGIPPGVCVIAVIRLGNIVIFAANGPISVAPAGRQPPEKMYFPGTTTPSDAERLSVAAGEERTDVDLVLRADPPALPVLAQALIAQRGGAPPPAPDATAIVRGRVSAMDGRALARAQVQLVPDADRIQSRAVAADADGHFEFRDLAAGKFHMYASKPGYATIESQPGGPIAATPASDRAFELSAAETRESLDLTLSRWGSVSGAVVDDERMPIVGASVQLLEIAFAAGRRRLVPARQAANLTDDRGRYRVFAVPPGRYVISASVGGASTADLPGFARGYFPNASDAAAAQFITLGRSEDVAGIDVSLSRTKTAKITGQVVNADGVPTNPGSLQLLPSARSGSLVGVPTGARLTPDGAFEFPNVPPGQYIIRADRGRTNAIEGEFGAVPVSVNGADIAGIVVHTSAGSSIKGRFRFESYNNAKTPEPSAVELSPMPVDYDIAPSNPASAAIHSDWTFDLAGINGPRRLQLLRAPAGWMLKEIRARGADVTDRPMSFGTRDQSLADVEVVLTDRISELAGRVVDDQDRPVPRAEVLVVSTDRTAWYAASRFMRRVVTDTDGTFTAAGLPFGSYTAAAFTRLPFPNDDQWQDPAFLETIAPRATSVTLAEGRRQTITLRAGSQ